MREGLFELPLSELWNTDAVPEKITAVTNAASRLYQDSRGAIWVAPLAYEGAFARVMGGAVEHFGAHTSALFPVSGRVFGFVEGPDGILYISSSSGVFCYDGKEFSSLQASPDRLSPTGPTTTAYRDSAGVLWCGTENGLFRYDGRTWMPLDEEDGLSGPEVRCVIEDNNGD
jgi:ligand-binding sensor domain-containing protein